MRRLEFAAAFSQDAVPRRLVVTTRVWSSLVLSAAMSLLAGCGGGSTLNLQNPPAPPSGNVAIAFNPAPPNSLPLNGTASLTAVVSNDPSSSGVDWSLNCQNPGNCGSISPSHTPSGQTTTYTPPAAFAGNNYPVKVVAFATADHSRNITASIAVTAFGSALTGNYVIGTSGADFSGQPYQRAGVMTLDGNGGITGGEQTVNFVNPNSATYTSVTDSITGGTYFVGMDGRGELVINTNDQSIGQNGVETFSLVVLTSSHVLLTKIDDFSFQGSSNETSVGTLDLQTPAPAPTLGYAFVANGTDTGGSAMGLGGVFNVDSPLSISGTGSAFDVASPNNNGPGVVTPSSAVSGTVSAPDALGAFQVALATDFATVQFTAYPIDATHAKLIESDGSFGLTAGDAYSQGAATGTYKKKKNFVGSYVVGIFGRDLGGGSASLAAGGLFTTTGAGTLNSGYLDESQSSDLVQISDKFHATYAVGPGSDPTIVTDPAGTGRYYIPASVKTGFPNFIFATHKNGTGSAWVFYTTTSGGPVLVLDADVEPVLTSGLSAGGVGTGIAYPIVAGSAFSGSYGTIFTQNLQGNEGDVVGKIAASNNALSGVLDLNSAFGPQVDDTSLTGSFQASAIANRLTGSLSDTFFVNSQGTTSLGMAFYPIDSTQGFFVENDLADSAGNPISGDLTFGYYATRTPVCQGCP